MNVTVYSTPKCVQCKLTKGWLDDNGIPYDAVDLPSAPVSVQEAVMALGYLRAPGVIVNDNGDTHDEKHWYGFRPDLLEEFTTTKEAA